MSKKINIDQIKTLISNLVKRSNEQYSIESLSPQEYTLYVQYILRHLLLANEVLVYDEEGKIEFLPLATPIAVETEESVATILPPEDYPEFDITNQYNSYLEVEVLFRAASLSYIG
ncbi:MAG: hypothetical protein SFT68_05575 [Rickettsiaceae bacterium]|nr:hypothetical protein [Rickettsiaceae bacterium]